MTVFFDIGETLGWVTEEGQDPPTLKLTAYPYVAGVLEGLANDQHRLGVISNTGPFRSDVMNPLLESQGILSFFEDGLLLYSAETGKLKNSPETFTDAARIAGAEIGECLFVGESPQERIFAAEAGMKVASHPLLVAAAINGESFRYAAIRPPASAGDQAWRTSLKDSGFLPLGYRPHFGLLGVIPQSLIPVLIDRKFEVFLLGEPDAPLTSDLYLLRDDVADETGFMASEGQSQSLLKADDEYNWILGSTGDGILLALPGNRSIEDYHFDRTEHGHNQMLKPDLALLNPFGAGVDLRPAAFLAGEPPAEPDLTGAETAAFAGLTQGVISDFLERYTGAVPPGQGQTPLVSRHIHHADNDRATAMLVDDLAALGGGGIRASRHPFVHEGRTLHNVIGEIPGDPGDEWVLVTAHLDSTAASSPPYDPENDSAPGADDDASGIAGVLALADLFGKLSAEARLKRTIQFVLFNAEEHGLIGSQAYARDLAAIEAPITSVFQMDMIGYNKEAPRSFEVHCGYWGNPDVQERSLRLANRIQRLTGVVSPLLESPQIYLSTGPDPGSGGDPAEGRSDHGPFHDRGYAACVISEDFFIGPSPGSPQPEPNPGYHKNTDDFIDFEFAADIARAVGAAALISARI